jgi:sugar phosphate isomerase/epimerase
MKPTLFSVSYAGLWGQARLTLEDFVSHAHNLGYCAIEIMGKRPHLSPLDWDDARVEHLAALCQSEGIEVACVAAYTHWLAGAGATEVPLVEMQIQYVESLARMAAALDCSLVRVFTAYGRPDLAPAEQWRRTAIALRECCDRAAPHGVNIGIQNHHDLAVHSKALLELYRDIDRPNLRLMLDPWSVCLRGEDPFTTAQELAPLVAYTTLADYVRLPRYRYRPELINYERQEPDLVRAVPLGDGEMNNLAFLRGLRSRGYHGPVAYEMCSPLRGGGSLENLDAAARQALSWLRETGFCQ